MSRPRRTTWILFLIVGVGLATHSALLLRTAPLPDTYNLIIYHSYGSLAADGINPYEGDPDVRAPPQGRDNPPFEFWILGRVLDVFPSSEAIRWFFFVFDAALIVLLAAFPARSPGWRIGAAAFYAFNPLVWYAWVVEAGDKPLQFLLLAWVIIAIEGARPAASVVVAGVLNAVKWLGSAFLAPLVLYACRYHRGAWPAAVAFLVVWTGHMFFFPESLLAYELKVGRTGIAPGHGGLLTFLPQTPWLGRLLLPTVLGGLAVAFLLRWMDARILVVASAIAWMTLLPDANTDRALFAMLVVLLVVRPSLWGWVLMSLASLPLALAWGVWSRALVRRDWMDPFFDAVGVYGGHGHAVLAGAVIVSGLLVLTVPVLGRLLVPSADSHWGTTREPTTSH